MDIALHNLLFQSEISKRYRQHIPAPKLTLPGHSESYNPPPEYLFTKDEVRMFLSGTSDMSVVFKVLILPIDIKHNKASK